MDDPAAPSTTGEPGPKHYASLDGLRGIAILLVMLAHFTMYSVPTGFLHDQFLKFTGAGWCGVDLFFVLSGFLITGILFDARTAPHYFRNFYMRRVLRILPLYYGILALLFIVGPRLAPGAYTALGPQIHSQAWIWLHGTNLLVARDGWRAVDSDWFHVGHFWSLAVEEHFYLLWPAVVARFDRPRLLRICEWLVVLPLALRMSLDAPMARYVLTPCRVDTLAVGCWIALAARAPGGLVTLVPVARRVAAMTGAALALYYLARPHFDWQRDGRITVTGLTLLALFFGASLVLAIAASPAGLAGRLLRGRLLGLLGRYSYAAYVFHLLLLPVTLVLFPESDLATLTGSALAGTVLAATLSIALCFIVAAASWHLYERHFLALKRYF